MGETQVIFGILITTLFLLLLVAGIYISISLAGKQRIRQEMKITQMELDYEKELRQVEAEVSEQMMERFAQELHDNIGHSLTVMRFTIENKKYGNPELDPIFEPIEKELNEASSQLRLLSHTLNTDYVSNIGLRQAIQIEVQKLQQLKRQQVYWKDNYSDDIGLNKNQELVAFRIFQEMIQNVLKHAKAKHIHISLVDEEGNLLLVADDGAGFDAAAMLNSAKGSGLKNMMKRAKMAGMECRIDAAAGKGCRYTLALAPVAVKS